MAEILATVGAITVPPAVLHHRFYREAKACAMLRGRQELERVVGTENTKRPELYGWGANVLPHVDDSGFMYFVPLSLDRSRLFVQDACGRLGTVCSIDDDAEIFEQQLQVG